MKLSIFVLAVVALQLSLFIDLAKGHGMILDPVGRGSRWRVDNTATPNYDDMGSNCGGFFTMFEENDGKCGICGDNYRDTNRAHELGGKYGGSGVIVKTYARGSRPEFVFNITASHLGFVYYEICNLDEFGSESEECFKQHRLNYADGSDKHDIVREGEYRTTVVLPQDLSCNHCILRWTYFGGNNWNFCDDGSGTGRLGCGPQETFKTCADIRITP